MGSDAVCFGEMDIVGVVAAGEVWNVAIRDLGCYGVETVLGEYAIYD